MRIGVLKSAVMAAAVLLPLNGPASAQLLPAWSTMCDNFSKSDFDVLHPLIQKMLHEDGAGASRPWTSQSGRSGAIHLISGGENAGSDQAVVRITTIRKGRERTLFTFKYRKDPKRGYWGVVG
jgi:hypothetical protein